MILVLTQCFPPDQGGIETLMGGLVGALIAQGQSVHVLADHIRSKSGAQAALDPALAGAPVERFGGMRPLRRWLKRRRAAQLIATGQVHAVIADSWKSLETLPDLPKLPVLVMIYGMEFPAHLSQSKQQRIRSALARATTLIPISRFSAAVVEPYRGTCPQVMVHPPLPDLPEPDDASRVALRAVLGPPSDGVSMMTLSRLEPRKGIDHVIRALPGLLKDFPSLVYYVGGGGADRQRLEALAEGLGVRQQVRFLGFVPEALKPALYEAVDVFVMPVRREGDSVEGFGIVYMEAAYYGVPSLAGSEGGAVDAVLDEQTGLIVDGSNPQAIAAQLHRLLADQALRDRLGSAARRRAREDFSWAHAVKTYLALCEGTPPNRQG